MNIEEHILKIQQKEKDELAARHIRQLEEIKKRPFNVNPGSMWLVMYECRYAVVTISPLGDGFFACGQEPLWGFSNIAQWVKEIEIPK